MRNMSNLNMDSFSTTSVTSKNSDYRKAPRFSLRRIFFRRSKSRAYASAKTKLNTESDSHSDSSSVSQSIELTKDVATSRSQSVSLVNVSPQPPFVVLMKKESADLVECPLCLQDQPYANFAVVMTCYHRSCRDCLRQYLRIEITESRIDISCPECAERYHPNDIRIILDDDNLMLKYEEFMLRRVLVADADTRWCPAPDCGYAVIAAGCASCPKLRCERPNCNTFFCYHCKQHWHPNQTCDAARAERSSNFRSVSVTNSHDSTTQSEIKPCPRCTAYITKMDDGSCNHMTCAVCGAEFCWLCMKEISDLHYLSPSGCTFWGKKPWSRKKKILWQLGTLIGAPVGIGLVAGIAVPAMIIGIPVWVGKKLHTRYGHLSLHKRNVVIASGVMASVVVSPVVASLAVSIGVPILLAYIYFVVPISLCRSGGCGVSTTDSGGVRFEFEEEHYTYGPTASDNHSIDTTSHRVANPSIGPSIGEMSMTMTGSLSASGSHLDRVGAIKDESDRESASNRAIAGCSLNGSLSGSACAGPVGFQNRLEVHADVLPSSAFNNKRSSFSSESANFSLSEKSGILFERDDVSMRTMAGSLRDKDFKNATTVTPSLEVQADICQNRNRNLSGNSIESTNHRIPSSHGSPMSNRSVSFVNDEKQLHCFGKSKRNRSGSRSFGDKIHEDVETPHSVVPDSLSMHSFIDDESNSRVSNIGDSSAHQSISLLGGAEFTAHVTYRDGNRQVPDLTEIESNFLDAPNQSKSKPLNNTARFTQGNQDANNLHFSFSEKRNGDSCKSPSEIELTAVAASLSLTHATGHRRRSCEVALAEGRVTLDDTTFAV